MTNPSVGLSVLHECVPQFRNYTKELTECQDGRHPIGWEKVTACEGTAKERSYFAYHYIDRCRNGQFQEAGSLSNCKITFAEKPTMLRAVYRLLRTIDRHLLTNPITLQLRSDGSSTFSTRRFGNHDLHDDSFGITRVANASNGRTQSCFTIHCLIPETRLMRRSPFPLTGCIESSQPQVALFSSIEKVPTGRTLIHECTPSRRECSVFSCKATARRTTKTCGLVRRRASLTPSTDSWPVGRPWSVTWRMLLEVNTEDFSAPRKPSSGNSHPDSGPSILHQPILAA